MNNKINLKRWPRGRTEAVLKFIDANKKDRILEIGCGSSQVLEYLSKKSNNVYGVDIDKEIIEEQKKRLKSSVKLKVDNKLEEGLSFEDSYFDIIILSDVIEHVSNRFEAMKELKRILKPGGQLVIVTPNVCKIRNRIRILLGKPPITSGPILGGYKAFKHDRNYDDGHLQYFTFDSLEKLGKLFNLKIIKKFGFGSYGKLQDIFRGLLSGEIGMIFRKKSKK